MKLTKKDIKVKIVLGDIMSAKEKKKVRIKMKVKNLIILLVFIVIILYSIDFYYFYFKDSKTFGKEENLEKEVSIQELKISKAEKVDIDKIISNNVNENKKEEIIKKEAELEYITKYENNPELPQGMIQVVQEGREGKQELVIKIVYENNEEASEEQISSKITKASVNKIVQVGTGNSKNNHKINIGDIVYATAERLSVMVEPNENATKNSTLQKNSNLKILEIQDEWYKISSGSVIGWVKQESTTYINPNAPKEDDTKQNSGSNLGDTKNKEQLNSTLDFNMALNKPSGFSLEQFQKVLSDSKDVNKIFSDNAQYFYYIEDQYNINGIFVASIGIHESNWGTSKIAKNKNNLFGYGAYDSNPYNGAYSFSTYAESIDLMARVIVKYYINPNGTSIYGGETAKGTYYNGSTLSGVNTKYASDKNWANCVYNYMKYLYQKVN